MTDKLIELTERCEQAKAGDYSIDLAITRTLFGKNAAVKPYTASLDAAMTLVPEGWDGALYLATDTHRPEVQLETPAMRQALSMDDERVEGCAVTLALALCAAALRARAS